MIKYDCREAARFRIRTKQKNGEILSAAFRAQEIPTALIPGSGWEQPFFVRPEKYIPDAI